MGAQEPKTMLRQISDEFQHYLGVGFFAVVFVAMALAATLFVEDAVARQQFYGFLATMAVAVVIVKKKDEQ